MSLPASPAVTPRPRRWLIAFGAAALLVPTLPNVVYFAVSENPAFWLGEWVTSMLLVIVPLLLGLSLRANLFCLLPFALLTPAALAFAWIARVPPSVLALQILEEAPRDEWSTFLPQAAMCGIVALGIGCFYLVLIRRDGVKTITLRGPSRIVASALLLGCLAKDVIIGHPSAAPMLLENRLEKMSPCGPLILLARLKFDGSMNRDRSGLLLHRVVRQQPQHPENEICVLVIGEAARVGDLGLYNQGLDSNPRLTARRDLVVFQHAAACGTLTDTAVPVVLTGRLPDGDGGGIASHLGLVEAFRLAGFHTAWISNQGADANIIDVLCSFAGSTHEKINLNGGDELVYGTTRAEHLDGALLDPLAQVLRVNTGKLFVVVHLIGSHEPYLHRYPPEFEKWPIAPSVTKSMSNWIPPYDRDQQTAINHARLNSAFYTDWLLDRILSLLNDTGRVAALAYLSDHGENLPNAPVLPAMHGTLTNDVIDIPLFFWFSDELKARQKMRLDGLAANVAKRVTATDIFPTLCGLFDLQVSEADPARNLLNPDYREHELNVVNMDNKVVTVRR